MVVHVSCHYDTSMQSENYQRLWSDSFLILLKPRNRTQFILRIHLIRPKLNERHAISAVKFEFRLGVEENAFCVQNISEMCFGTDSVLCRSR